MVLLQITTNGPNSKKAKQERENGRIKTSISSFQWPFIFYTTLLPIPIRYFRKYERFTPNKDFPEVDSSQRGTSGVIDSMRVLSNDYKYGLGLTYLT